MLCPILEFVATLLVGVLVCQVVLLWLENHDPT